MEYVPKLLLITGLIVLGAFPTIWDIKAKANVNNFLGLNNLGYIYCMLALLIIGLNIYTEIRNVQSGDAIDAALLDIQKAIKDKGYEYEPYSKKLVAVTNNSRVAIGNGLVTVAGTGFNGPVSISEVHQHINTGVPTHNSSYKKTIVIDRELIAALRNRIGSENILTKDIALYSVAGTNGRDAFNDIVKVLEPAGFKIIATGFASTEDPVFKNGITIFAEKDSDKIELLIGNLT